MRLLPLASFIALMSHLIPVSAVDNYKCPSKAKFTTTRIYNLANLIIAGRITEGVKDVVTSSLTTSSFIFDRQTINGVKYEFMIMVRNIDRAIDVYEMESGRTRICELIT
ncbi:putative candidate secreted effector protein [Blumeria hordei DH14]|uniref:Putative candidate secreted effector protein n=1 Tax=Blumeria graminis f. sp. hordei (strain DH14) TaxID=546991 RepID=N1JBH3_BLUG1|nr:putative candidate secreted effector protein [Blumeria hordei DH14]